MDEITVSFEWGRDEFARAGRWLTLNRGYHLYLLLILVFVAFPFLLAIFAWLIQSNTLWTLAFIILPPGIMCVLFIGAIFWLAASRSLNTNSWFMGTVHITLSNQSLVFQSQVMKSEILWKAFDKVFITKEFYFLRYVGRGHFICFPRRMFESEDQERNFRKILEGAAFREGIQGA